MLYYKILCVFFLSGFFCFGAEAQHVHLTVREDKEAAAKQDYAKMRDNFLREMSRREMLTVKNDSLYFTIPFDIHAPDCGAPDCYVTTLHFGIEKTKEGAFPEEIFFTETEEGCYVEDTLEITGHFDLTAGDQKTIIYSSETYNRTLVLVNPQKGKLNILYYVEPSVEINLQNARLFTEARERDFPYMNSGLQKNSDDPVNESLH